MKIMSYVVILKMCALVLHINIYVFRFSVKY
jgi:hypothetical protein